MSLFTGILVVGGAFAYLAWRHYRLAHELALARQGIGDTSNAGHFVEVDCAACSKMNRIPAARLRSRPLCGGCKARLLPKRRIVVCHVRNLAFDPALRVELDGVMTDYDRFWATLDAHFRRRGAAGVVDAKDLPN